jgi:hypothetical protein
MESGYFVKITNNKQVILENISSSIGDISPELLTSVRIKEEDIDTLRGKSYLWQWYEDFCQREDLPTWVSGSQVLIFELIQY